MTSQNFSSNLGSFESLNVRTTCGFKSFRDQMRCTVLDEIPACRAMLRTLQRVRPLRGRVTSVMTFATSSSGRDGFWPLPALSSSPARPDVSKRDDHSQTVLGEVFSRPATSPMLTPSSGCRLFRHETARDAD
jgi:hypothetical protein